MGAVGKSMAIRRRIGDTRRIAVVLKNLHSVAFDQGELAHATGYIEESLAAATADRRPARHRQLAGGGWRDCSGAGMLCDRRRNPSPKPSEYIVACGSDWAPRSRSTVLASIDCDLGNFGRARRRCQFSLSTLQEVDKGFYLAQVQVTVGKIAYATGDHTTARVHFEESIALRHKLSDHLRIAESFSWLALIADAQADNYQALTHLRESLTIYQSYKTTHNVAACLEALGLVLHGQSQRAPARATLEMATALRIANGTPTTASRAVTARPQAGRRCHMACRQSDRSEAIWRFDDINRVDAGTGTELHCWGPGSPALLMPIVVRLL